jgi:thiamine pyrophosphokinase
MKSVAIICDGQFPKKDYPIYLIHQADYIVCCDGAVNTFLRHIHDRIPDIVIGDMDSIKSLPGFPAEHIVKVEEQDDNDQTKAFNYAIGHFKDIDSIHILGATGKREDHTLGNMSLLMEYSRTYDLEKIGIKVDMVSDWSTIFAITDTTSIEVGEGRRISIFSPDNSLTIKSSGLVWPTDNVLFDNWWKATLNRASEDTVTLSFNHPSIALIVLD